MRMPKNLETTTKVRGAKALAWIFSLWFTGIAVCWALAFYLNPEASLWFFLLMGGSYFLSLLVAFYKLIEELIGGQDD